MSRMTDTSRSPYTVSASVRGIGVAVITSTSGIRPFARSVARCTTPKRCCSSMIARPSERKCTSPARARACRRPGGCRPAARRASRSRRFRPVVAPVMSSTRKRDCLQQLSQAEKVLLGENLGRRHERHLQAVLHRDERREQRHDRLARADVALQQPVHRRRPLHVVDDLLQRAPLSFGQLERQNAARRFADAIVDLDRRAASTRAPPRACASSARAETERTLRRSAGPARAFESVQPIRRRVRRRKMRARSAPCAGRAASGAAARSSGNGSGRSSGSRDSTSNTRRRCIFGVMAPAFS